MPTLTPPLVNGAPVTVTYVDGSTESVSLSRLTISQLYVFVEHLKSKDAAALVALCTGRSAAWIDTLHDESFAELAERVMQENFPRAQTISKRDPVMSLKIAPLLVDLAIVEKHASELLSGRALPGSSAGLSPSASAEEIGTAAAGTTSSASNTPLKPLTGSEPKTASPSLAP